MVKLLVVNKDLLPIKLHFFLFFGAMGGCYPYMQVVAKSIGINATAVGIIYTVLSISVFFSKPIFGYLTDHFRNFKIILITLAIITVLSYLSIVFIPPIDSSARNTIPVHLSCSDNSQFSFHILDHDKICIEEALKRRHRFEFEYTECGSNSSLNMSGTMDALKFEPSEKIVGNSTSHSLNINASRLIAIIQPNGNFTCGCVVGNESVLRLSNPYVTSRFCKMSEEISVVYGTNQFWIFTLFAVISGTADATVSHLSDAACYEVLEGHPELYGRQRLWATISYGFITLFAGFLNDLTTESSGQENYSPGFCLMTALVLMDVMLLMKISLTKVNFSTSICRDIGKVFSSFETIIFTIAVYIIGALTSIIWNYELWFLQDLGADQTLLGMAVAVQSLGAELPFFFFSGWFIDTFGYFFCLSFTLAAFALRFMFYFLLENPWLVLPVDILHGFTFALFYACMTSYATSCALSGTEATMMGILGGLYEGFGVVTGSLLGGIGFDKFGGRHTFLVASIISFICIPLLLICYFLSNKISRK